jgi:hypothetical protein
MSFPETIFASTIFIGHHRQSCPEQNGAFKGSILFRYIPQSILAMFYSILAYPTSYSVFIPAIFYATPAYLTIVVSHIGDRAWREYKK